MLTGSSRLGVAGALSTAGQPSYDISAAVRLGEQMRHVPWLAACNHHAPL